MINPEHVYKRGDVVLVNFIFSDETSAKRRPALVFNTDAYQEKRREIIVAAITSNTRRCLIGDHIITDYKKAGLLYPSTVTAIIRTIKQVMIQTKLGILSSKDFHTVEHNLRQILGL